MDRIIAICFSLTYSVINYFTLCFVFIRTKNRIKNVNGSKLRTYYKSLPPKLSKHTNPLKQVEALFLIDILILIQTKNILKRTVIKKHFEIQ